MLTRSTCITYPVCLVMSIGKKSFEALGRAIDKSGKTASRFLQPLEANISVMQSIARHVFRNAKVIVLTMDDSLIAKMYSKNIVGTGWFYHTKLGKKILSLKLMAGGITDGKHMFPLFCSLLYDKDFCSEPIQSKTDVVKSMILSTEKIFPDKQVYGIADGAFANKEVLAWAVENKKNLELRMHKNRIVEFKEKRTRVDEIDALILRGRQMARTVIVRWYGMQLYVTAVKRIDKHREESIIYQVATFDAKPSQHAKMYRKRWPIEMFFRTAKETLGLKDCFSTGIKTQLDHASSVMLAYSLSLLEMKRLKLQKPEQAIRALKLQNPFDIIKRFNAIDQIFRN